MSPSDLVAAARAVRRHAHAPYSRFAVGAAALFSDGSIAAAANLENASTGLSLCAETIAVAIAAAQGRLADIVAVAVAGGALDGPDGSAVVRPCGRCRQVLAEAAGLGGRDILVHCAGVTGDAIESHALSALLPFAFGPGDLDVGGAAQPG